MILQDAIIRTHSAIILAEAQGFTETALALRVIQADLRQEIHPERNLVRTKYKLCTTHVS